MNKWAEVYRLLLLAERDLDSEALREAKRWALKCIPRRARHQTNLGHTVAREVEGLFGCSIIEGRNRIKTLRRFIRREANIRAIARAQAYSIPILTRDEVLLALSTALQTYVKKP